MSDLDFDLDEMRDLFREEARALLAQLRTNLEHLVVTPGDGSGFDELIACGGTLQGSGALVAVPAVSRAGALLAQAAGLARDRLSTNPAASATLTRTMATSLAVVDRLVEICVAADDSSQNALLDEFLAQFPAADRGLIADGIAIESAASAGDARPGATLLEIGASEALIAHLTDLLVAHSELGSTDGEVEALHTTLRSVQLRLTDRLATNSPPELVRALVDQAVNALDQCAAIIDRRTAAALALTQAVEHVHRTVATSLGLPTPIEPVIVMDVDGTSYAVVDREVESVHVLDATHLERTGSSLRVRLGDEPLVAVDLGTLIAKTAQWSPTTAVVLRVDGQRFAVLAGDVQAPRPMVLRTLEGILAHHPLVQQATVGSHGEAVFVLSATALRGALDALRPPA